jgi:hypothetical protein
MNHDDCLSLYVNDKKLVGIRRGVKWSWACDAFPSITKQFDGGSDPQSCINEFMRLCLEPALKAREQWEKSG